MYESFYGFKENPFQIIPDPNFLYLSPTHENALKYLEYGIERNIGIFLLTGEVGSGKTTLIKYVAQQIGQNIEVAIISNTNLPADQLLSYILFELGIEHSDESKAQNLTIFKNYLKYIEAENHRSILIVDEAQNLPKDALEELRMLSNFQADDQMPLQIFLVGQPELRTILNSPGMNQIRQRIAVNYHLKGLNFEETQKYIEYRISKAGGKTNPFTYEAIALIHKSTVGIPRSINLICDSALLYGFADELNTIDMDVIQNLLKDLNFTPPAIREPVDLKPTDNLPQKNEAIQVSHLPGKPDPSNNLIKKGLILINKKLDRLDIKLDLLRKDFLNSASDSARTNRYSYGDLVVESAKIQSEFDKLKAKLQSINQLDGETDERVNNGSGIEKNGKTEIFQRENKVYKLEK